MNWSNVKQWIDESAQRSDLNISEVTAQNAHKVASHGDDFLSEPTSVRSINDSLIFSWAPDFSPVELEATPKGFEVSTFTDLELIAKYVFPYDNGASLPNEVIELLPPQIIN